jgi:hypothetical protein
MARAPFALWKPLPSHGHEPSITPRVVIYHTMVGNLKGVDAYFRGGTSGGIESHFGVACPKCESEYGIPDGQVWQWMDTGEQADANYHANVFAISVETCDHYKGGTYTNPPLSDAQIDSWVKLGKWAHDVHGVKLQRCNAWDGSGYGYHSMWGSPSNWTPTTGKTCPNPTRIDQFNKIVLPRVVSSTTTGGLSVSDVNDILEAIAALRRDLTVYGTTGLESTVEKFAERQRETLAKIDALLALLAPPSA